MTICIHRPPSVDQLLGVGLLLLSVLARGTEKPGVWGFSLISVLCLLELHERPSEVFVIFIISCSRQGSWLADSTSLGRNPINQSISSAAPPKAGLF